MNLSGGYYIMVKQVPYFEDSSGKPHKTPYDAWRAELMLWLTSTKAFANETQARTLIDYVTLNGVEGLQRIVNELAECQPPLTKPAAHFDDTEQAV
jgi:hypothetical protein